MVVHVRELSGQPDYGEHPFGLYSVVDPETSESFRVDEIAQWVEWCGKVRTIGLPCQGSPGEQDPAPPADQAKVPDSSVTEEAENFGLYFRPVCDSPISGVRDRIISAAFDVASATEQKVVEHELWTNVFEGCTPAIDECADVRAAFGAVEQALAWELPMLGVIHVPLWASAYLTDVGILQRVGDQVQTVSGTPVVLGAGYFGAPADLPDIEGFYIVGTGRVRVVRTPPVDPERTYVFDSDINLHTTLTERKVAVGYGCVCVYAPVTTTCIPEPLDAESP